MDTPTFIPVDRVARKLGVGVAWLQREAIGGRIPTLRAGNRLLADVEQVAQALRDRAAQAPAAQKGGER